MLKKMIMFAAVAGLVLALAPATQAALINMDVNGDNAQFTGAAALGAAGDTWNYSSHSGTVSNLKDSDGNTTAVSITLANFSGQDGMSSCVNRPVAHDALMDSAWYHGGGHPVTLSGLDFNQSYELIVYAHGDRDDRDSTIDITTGSVPLGDPLTQSTATWTAPHTLSEGLDYVRWASVTSDGTGQIVLNFRNHSDSYGHFSGLQIVPEPATLALLIGAPLLALLRRRRA